VVPGAALADVPAALRTPAGPAARAVGLGGERDELREQVDGQAMPVYYKESGIS
jgi:hypothetical protein